MTQLLREHAEQQYAEELRALAQHDRRLRPPSWRLSPWAVATYVLGGRLDDGFVVAPKRDVGRGVFVTLSACYGRRCYSREQADDVVFDGVLFVEHNVDL